jgi:hypothetical protein
MANAVFPVRHAMILRFHSSKHDRVEDCFERVGLMLPGVVREPVSALVALEERDYTEAIPTLPFLDSVRCPAGGTGGVGLLEESEGHVR